MWADIDPKTGTPRYRADLLEMQLNKPVNVCPSTEGGKNWQAMSYHQPTGLLIAPLSQSCMEFTAREVDFSGCRRRKCRRPQVPADAGNQWQHGQARGVRREDVE